jgi:Fe-S-cluster-containing hydrogenase component 2
LTQNSSPITIFSSATTAIVQINDEACVGCRRCVNVCPSDALEMNGKLAVLTDDKCVGCFKCVEACIPYNAISARRDPNPRELGVPPERLDRPEVRELCAKARFDPEQAICMCTSTTAAEVAAAILDGVREPEELTLATGVRAKCGMWCLAPTMRLLAAHGIEIERSSKDHRIYGDGDGTDVAIWTIPDDVADRYPEYRLRESKEAVESGQNLNSSTPMFPDIQPEQRP